MSEAAGLGRLVICATGICVCYLGYGYLFEHLFEDDDHLGATFVLVTQCVTNTAVAYGWQQVSESSKADSKQPLRHGLLLVASACYVGAMACSNEAVVYVSYPVAVLAKSCKLIPTMLVGQLVEGRLYSMTEWMAALLISFGIVLFHFSRMKDGSSLTEGGSDAATYGMTLLSISLGLDGVLASFQNFIKRPMPNFRVPNAIETMLWMNLYAIIFLVPMAIYSGQWANGMRLFAEQTQVLTSKIALLNLTVAAGQVFIFLTITWYSPVITTTITTTRKFCTILLSVLTFGHSFTTIQWVAIGLVFAGLYLAILMVQRRRSAAAEKRD